MGVHKVVKRLCQRQTVRLVRLTEREIQLHTRRHSQKRQREPDQIIPASQLQSFLSGFDAKKPKLQEERGKPGEGQSFPYFIQNNKFPTGISQLARENFENAAKQLANASDVNLKKDSRPACKDVKCRPVQYSGCSDQNDNQVGQEEGHVPAAETQTNDDNDSSDSTSACRQRHSGSLDEDDILSWTQRRKKPAIQDDDDDDELPSVGEAGETRSASPKVLQIHSQPEEVWDKDSETTTVLLEEPDRGEFPGESDMDEEDTMDKVLSGKLTEGQPTEVPFEFKKGSLPFKLNLMVLCEKSDSAEKDIEDLIREHDSSIRFLEELHHDVDEELGREYEKKRKDIWGQKYVSKDMLNKRYLKKVGACKCPHEKAVLVKVQEKLVRIEEEFYNDVYCLMEKAYQKQCEELNEYFREEKKEKEKVFQEKKAELEVVYQERKRAYLEKVYQVDVGSQRSQPDLSAEVPELPEAKPHLDNVMVEEESDSESDTESEDVNVAEPCKTVAATAVTAAEKEKCSRDMAIAPIFPSAAKKNDCSESLPIRIVEDESTSNENNLQESEPSAAVCLVVADERQQDGCQTSGLDNCLSDSVPDVDVEPEEETRNTSNDTVLQQSEPHVHILRAVEQMNKETDMQIAGKKSQQEKDVDAQEDVSRVPVRSEPEYSLVEESLDVPECMLQTTVTDLVVPNSTAVENDQSAFLPVLDELVENAVSSGAAELPQEDAGLSLTVNIGSMIKEVVEKEFERQNGPNVEFKSREGAGAAQVPTEAGSASHPIIIIDDEEEECMLQASEMLVVPGAAEPVHFAHIIEFSLFERVVNERIRNHMLSGRSQNISEKNFAARETKFLDWLKALWKFVHRCLAAGDTQATIVARAVAWLNKNCKNKTILLHVSILVDELLKAKKDELTVTTISAPDLDISFDTTAFEVAQLEKSQPGPSELPPRSDSTTEMNPPSSNDDLTGIINQIFNNSQTASPPSLPPLRVKPLEQLRYPQATQKPPKSVESTSDPTMKMFEHFAKLQRTSHPESALVMQGVCPPPRVDGISSNQVQHTGNVAGVFQPSAIHNLPQLVLRPSHSLSQQVPAQKLTQLPPRSSHHSLIQAASMQQVIATPMLSVDAQQVVGPTHNMMPVQTQANNVQLKFLLKQPLQVSSPTSQSSQQNLGHMQDRPRLQNTCSQQQQQQQQKQQQQQQQQQQLQQQQQQEQQQQLQQQQKQLLQQQQLQQQQQQQQLQQHQLQQQQLQQQQQRLAQMHYSFLAPRDDLPINLRQALVSRGAQQMPRMPPAARGVTLSPTSSNWMPENTPQQLGGGASSSWRPQGQMMASGFTRADQVYGTSANIPITVASNLAPAPNLAPSANMAPASNLAPPSNSVPVTSTLAPSAYGGNVPQSSTISAVCTWCHLPGLYTCSDCSGPIYCSKLCQDKHWAKHHNYECKNAANNHR